MIMSDDELLELLSKQDAIYQLYISGELNDLLFLLYLAKLSIKRDDLSMTKRLIGDRINDRQFYFSAGQEGNIDVLRLEGERKRS